MKPRKNEKGQTRTSPLRLKGKKEMLLARWTDGLFYFVKITKVSDINRTCVVEFEDKSIATVHFKDLLEEKEEDVTMCHCCGRNEVEQSNVLVKCDNCDRDYHQTCHIPPITLSGDQDDKFVCRICVFTSCAQAGGAKKSGPLALKYAEMKQYFPYDNKYLTWNATHTSNVEQSFCYCGGPGIWYNKMLQCCRCRQWFHEACIQCLEMELLLGDRFFIFACAHCNYGVEFIQRMDLSWLDIAFITLFHLIMTLGKRYIDLESDIVPFIMGRAHNFGLKKLLNGLHGSFEAVSTELVKVFHKQNVLFCCGSEVKKRCTFYGLRERIPPCPPPLSIPASDEVITAETLSCSSGRRVIFTPSKFTLQVPYVLRGGNRVVPPNMGAKLRESKLAKIARVKSEHNYCTPVKCLDDSLSRRLSKGDEACWEGFDANNNSPSTQSQPKIELGMAREAEIGSNSHHEEGTKVNVVFSPVTERENTFWSLDTAFPEPLNFSGANHPFLTEFEQENLHKQRQHFEHQLEVLSALLLEDGVNNATNSAYPILSPIGASPSAIKDVKGFKGELADLINSTCGSNTSTPKKTKCSPHKAAELSVKDEKHFDRLNPPRNGVLYRRNYSPPKAVKESRLSRPTPCYINGVKISPKKVNKAALKNGLTCIKSEPSTSANEKMEDIHGKEIEKRLKALNRCLKNLTPTCGFRFPVLEESHPAAASIVVSSLVCNGPESKRLAGTVSCNGPESKRLAGTVSFNGPESKRLAGTVSAAPLTAVPTVINSRLNSDSLSKNRKRANKRKYEAVEYSHREDIKDQSAQNAENVRRSHRSRCAIQRFEAASCNTNYGLGAKAGSLTGGLAGAEQYDVISLRVGPDSGLVEYLVNWAG